MLLGTKLIFLCLVDVIYNILQFHSFLALETILHYFWQNSIPPYIYNTFFLSIHLLQAPMLTSCLGYCAAWTIDSSLAWEFQYIQAGWQDRMENLVLIFGKPPYYSHQQCGSIYFFTFVPVSVVLWFLNCSHSKQVYTPNWLKTHIRF